MRISSAPGIWDPSSFADLLDLTDIVLPEQHQCGHVDLRQPGDRGWIGRDLQSGSVQLEVANVIQGDRADDPTDRIFGAERRPDLEREIRRAGEVASLDGRLDRREDRLPDLVGPFEAREAGRREDQRGHALGVIAR